MTNDQLNELFDLSNDRIQEIIAFLEACGITGDDRLQHIEGIADVLEAQPALELQDAIATYVSQSDEAHLFEIVATSQDKMLSDIDDQAMDFGYSVVARFQAQSMKAAAHAMRYGIPAEALSQEDSDAIENAKLELKSAMTLFHNTFKQATAMQVSGKRSTLKLPVPPTPLKALQAAS